MEYIFQSSHTWNVMIVTKKRKPQERESKWFKWKTIWNDSTSILQISYIIAKWIRLWSKQVYLKELEKRLVCRYFKVYRASLVAQMVKRLPAMWENWVRSLDQLGRSPGGGNGNPLQYSCLENFMDRGGW